MTDLLIAAQFMMLAAGAAMYGPLDWRFLVMLAAVYLAVRFAMHLIRGRR